MKYALKRKEMDLAVFDVNSKYEVIGCVLYKDAVSYYPLPLKRLVKEGYNAEFLEEEIENYYILNEDGCTLVDEWIDNRAIPLNRFNLKDYLNNKSNPKEWLFANNGYAFTDAYWVVSESEDVSYEDILKRKENLETLYTTKVADKKYKGYNATLGGQLEKFWFKEGDDTCLCKKTNETDDVLIAREIVGSVIYERQATLPFCKYDFVLGKDGGVYGCKCKCFTSDNLEIVTASDLLEEYNYSQCDDVWDKIVSLASSYGLDKQMASDYLDTITMVNYLITNRDNHQGNIAFLRDVETLKIVSPAPVYDNGSSKHMEGQSPESVLNTTVNGLYPTELELLSHVSNFNLVDVSKLPTVDEVRAIYDRCKGLSEYRKSKLCDLYAQKVAFLKELQLRFNNFEDVGSYLGSVGSHREDDCDINSPLDLS